MSQPSLKNHVEQSISAHTWFDILAHAYAAELGYVFLVSGNIADVFPYQKHFLSMRHLLAAKFADRQIVVFWDKSSGFVFGDEILGSKPQAGQLPMREQFKAAVGLNQQTNANAASNLLASLGGAGNANSALPTDPERAFQLLEKLLSQGRPEEKKTAVVVEYVESVLPENDYQSVVAVTLQRWASLDSPLRGTGNPVILVERNPERASNVVKHDDSNVVRIHIPRPSKDELKSFIAYSLELYGVKLAVGLNIELAANLCSGLRCKDFDDFCAKSVESLQPISETFMWQKKVSLIEKQSDGVLQVVRPTHGFEAIGGLDHVIDALKVQVHKLRSGDRTCDKGWILMGPPGSGKSILAEALAKESGVNFLTLGNVLSKYVGDSERNMRLALDIARAMAPTIIFIDEAAEAIGSGNEYAGDSGVSNRVRGMLQNVMGDDGNRGKLFFMLATNYPNRLAPAIMREGRMDKRVPLLYPNDLGRAAIFAALCVKYAIDAAKIDFCSVVASTNGWSGAELEALLLRAKQFAEEERNASEVTTSHLLAAFEDYIPSRDQEAVDLMTLLAIRYTNSRRLLPPEYRSANGEIQQQIDTLEPRVVEREFRHKRGGLKL